MILHLAQIFFTDARTFMADLKASLQRPKQLNDLSPGRIVRREFHHHSIAGSQPHKVNSTRAGRTRQHQPTIVQLHPERCPGQQLHDGRLDRHRPAIVSSATHGRVSTHGPSAVIATQCSKCAEYDPSTVRAVQRSGASRLSGRPALTIGSIASTIPSFNRGLAL